MNGKRWLPCGKASLTSGGESVHPPKKVDFRVRLTWAESPELL